MKKRTLTPSPPRLSSAPRNNHSIQLGLAEGPFSFDIPGARTSDNEDEVGAVGGMSVRLSSLFLLTSVLALQKSDTPFLVSFFHITLVEIRNFVKNGHRIPQIPTLTPYL
jgi:hypothetical protein